MTVWQHHGRIVLVDGLARVGADKLRVGAVGVRQRSTDQVERSMAHRAVEVLHRSHFTIARGRLERREAGLQYCKEARLLGQLMYLVVVLFEHVGDERPSVLVEQILKNKTN